jgi:hypothetical protein
MKQCIMMLAMLAAGVSLVWAADTMTFKASMGDVTFDHKAHQERLKDCTKCHEKEPGKIVGFGKDWAHKTCKGCHTELAKGPKGCKECHKK